MTQPIAYIITRWSLGEGVYPGENQIDDWGLACDQVYLKSESAHVQAKVLCEQYAKEHEGWKTEETVDEATGIKYYTAMLPENEPRYDFYDYVEFRVMELELCDM